jgi:predicted Zn-dependent protease
MTTNVNNTGVAHLAFRLGGTPFCKNRRAFVTVTDTDRKGYAICKRCEARLAKMRTKKEAA